MSDNADVNLHTSARNFPEDVAHENGNYCNTCMYCEMQFIGHKRRVVCAVCEKRHDVRRGEDATSEITALREQLRQLSENVLQCIDASWKPHLAREWGAHLGNILGEYVGEVCEKLAIAWAERDKFMRLRDEQVQFRIRDESSVQSALLKAGAVVGITWRDEAGAVQAKTLTPVEMIEMLAGDRDSWLAEVNELREAEAACCPEDVGFPEYIAHLVKVITDTHHYLAALQRIPTDTSRDDVLQALVVHATHTNGAKG